MRTCRTKTGFRPQGQEVSKNNIHDQGDSQVARDSISGASPRDKQKYIYKFQEMVQKPNPRDGAPWRVTKGKAKVQELHSFLSPTKGTDTINSV